MQKFIVHSRTVFSPESARMFSARTQPETKGRSLPQNTLAKVWGATPKAQLAMYVNIKVDNG